MNVSAITPSEQVVSNLEFFQEEVRNVKDLGVEVDSLYDAVSKPTPLADVTTSLLDSLYDLSCGSHEIFMALTSNTDIVSPLRKIAYKAQTFILAETEDFFI